MVTGWPSSVVLGEGLSDSALEALELEWSPDDVAEVLYTEGSILVPS